jgi:L-lactate permease
VRNAPAVWSVLLGVLATAAIPAAVAYADRSPRVELIWAGAAVPVAALLGLAALGAARAGRRRARLTLVGRSGAAFAVVGRFLGLFGLLFAGSGTISLVVYAILSWRGRT